MKDQLAQHYLRQGLLLSFIVLFQNSGYTATQTTTFNVTASITATCTISASGALAFGAYDPLSVTANDNTNTLTIACTNTTPYTVSLDAGTGAGATVAVRKMTSTTPNATLNYSLYQDASRTTLWGNTIGTNTVAGTGNGTNQNLTVYGRIPASQTSPPSTSGYTDLITATVTY